MARKQAHILQPLHTPDWHAVMLSSIAGIPHLEGRRLDEHQAELLRLSALFNRIDQNGDGIGRSYLEDTAALRAYMLYYSTVNMLKFHRPLDELDRATGMFLRNSLRVLDLGSGTGTALLGLASWLEARGRIQSTPELSCLQVDRSARALDMAMAVGRFLEQHVLPGRLNLDMQRGELLRFTSPAQYDLIIISNTLNEIRKNEHRQLRGILERVLAHDGAVLLLEPALRMSSRMVLQFRDEALQEGWTVAAPCFFSGPCPALAAEKDWCHADDPWERPSWMEQLDRAMGNVKLSLKYSYLVLTRSGASLNAALGLHPLYRVVSRPAQEKGRTRAFLCGPGGRHLFMQNSRDAGEATRAFHGANRYDILSVSGAVQRESDVVLPRDAETSCVTP